MFLFGGLGGMEENKKSRWVCFKLESRGVCTITNPEHHAIRQLMPMKWVEIRA